MWCLAVPSVSGEGDVYRPVSVSGPKYCKRAEKLAEELPNPVLRTATVIRVNLT